MNSVLDLYVAYLSKHNYVFQSYLSAKLRNRYPPDDLESVEVPYKWVTYDNIEAYIRNKDESISSFTYLDYIMKVTNPIFYLS